MKVVFLDIDGVLNCKRTPNPRKFPFIVDAVLRKRLERLLHVTGAQVVLSSSWRFDPAGIFSAKYYGVPYSDMIPDLPDHPRCEEILAWLREHRRWSDTSLLTTKMTSSIPCRSFSHGGAPA